MHIYQYYNTVAHIQLVTGLWLHSEQRPRTIAWIPAHSEYTLNAIHVHADVMIILMNPHVLKPISGQLLINVNKQEPADFVHHPKLT